MRRTSQGSLGEKPQDACGDKSLTRVKSNVYKRGLGEEEVTHGLYLLEAVGRGRLALAVTECAPSAVSPTRSWGDTEPHPSWD